MNKQLRADFMLLVTAFIWGVAFVAQSAGMEFVGPFTFIAVRYMLAAGALGVVVMVRRGSERKGCEGVGEREGGVIFGFTRTEIVGGVCCGGALFVASVFQQTGIQTTSPGKAGFITSMYILLVPVLGLFLKQRARVNVWIGVGLSCVGLYLLCITDGGFSLATGDLLVMGCALCFSVHILVVDHFSPRADGVRMSLVQFLTAGILGAPFMFALEHPTAAQLIDGWLPIVYAGVMSGGIGYTLQVVAQRDAKPAIASLLMSLESVFAVLAEGMLMARWPTARELTGCVLMFAAIMIAQFGGKLCTRKEAL